MFKPVSSQVDFPKLERELLEWWYSSGIVDRYIHLHKNAKKKFSFLDGPITANNPMGVHHAWGRTFKDLWQRFWAMRGYSQRFQNGFDCQGLWVEVEVEKELGIRNKKDIENLIPGKPQESIAKFVALCKDRVMKFSAIQTQQSKRLGYFMDWDHSYYTMSDENNYMIWHFLKTCHEHGWIYKGIDSVPWCPRCETAISQHEMLTEDYKELTHETVFVKFPVSSFKFPVSVKNVYLLIWTTTPWTVPANVAVGINSKFTYAIWEHKGFNEAIVILSRDENGNAPKRLLKGKEVPLSEYLFDGVEGEFAQVGEWSGKELIGLTYEAPFDHLPRVQDAKKENLSTFHTVVDGSSIVVSTEGTGLLHVAPGAGKEDFDLGKKENLAVISVISDDASYLDGMAQFSGQNAKKHPDLIVDFLREKENGKFLLKSMPFTHRYPACWRCKAELVWKVTDEWYIAMNKPSRINLPAGKAGKQESRIKNKTLRERMIKVAKSIHWMPGFGLERELDWLKNMHDWLISKKNRYWGLALPIYECTSCGWFDVLGGKEELKDRAILGWENFDSHSPHKPYIDFVQISCPGCKKPVQRIEPVGNPWLDAGIVAYSTITNDNQGEPLYKIDRTEWKKWFPPEFITESFPGQFKNWFYSLIAMSTVLENTAPFKNVLGFATLLGEDGRPMHKSWGNAIEFNEGADKMGVDVMRWMYLTHNPEQNLLFGYKKADETRRRFHLLLWNVYNFFVTYANIDDVQHAAGSFQHGKKSLLNVLDRWILSRLNQTINIVTSSLEVYDAMSASESIEEFVSDLSLWYVRRSRDRIGPLADDTSDKADCYETLHIVLVTLAKLLAPFTPFLSEEIHKNLTGEESVHLAQWPEAESSMVDEKLEALMTYTRKIVELAHAQRKEKGIKVRQPLAKLYYDGPLPLTRPAKKTIPEELTALIQNEVNVKKIIRGDSEGSLSVRLDTTITPALRTEGETREFIRQVQILRKNSGCDLLEKIKIEAPVWQRENEAEILKKTLSKSIVWGETLRILRD